MPGHDTTRVHDGATPDALERYLARFALALAPLSPRERADILLETRGHVVERMDRAPGRPVDAVLAELGAPEEYARRFLGEPAPPSPVAPPPDTLHGLARLATGRLATLPLLALVLASYTIAVAMVVIAVSKLLEPTATGLDWGWHAPHRHVLLTVSNPAYHPEHDPLGWWLVPLLLGLATGIHLAMRALLRRLVLRRGAASLAIVLALLVPAGRASAQENAGQVEGTVTSAADATPVAFALVRLLPVAGTTDTTRRQAVASAQGRYRIAGVPAGEYRVQLLRIGFQPVVSAPVEVRAGATLHHDVRAASQAVQLAAVTVRAGQVCLTADRFAEEPRLATLWTEVLGGVELRRAFERQYRFVRHTRQDIEIHRVVGTKRQLRRDTLVNEPDSVDARDARRAAQNRERGYAKGGTLTLPYEKELVTETFMRDHCVDVPVADERGLLGLRFRPVERRKSGADVRGTIWVEGDSWQVRRIDFEYVRGGDAFAWGHLDYADVPVGRSAFRMPAGGDVKLDAGLAGLIVMARDATAKVTFTYRDFEQVKGR